LVSWLDTNTAGEDESRINGTQLGEMVGLDQSAISQIRTGNCKKSSKVEALCRVTKIPLPYMEVRPKVQEVVKAMNAMDERSPETLDFLLASYQALFKQLPKK
jgi:hypothetical protein